MKVPELRGCLSYLADAETCKRCKTYKKEHLITEILSLKRDSYLAQGSEPAAKRQKV